MSTLPGVARNRQRRSVGDRFRGITQSEKRESARRRRGSGSMVRLPPFRISAHLLIDAGSPEAQAALDFVLVLREHVCTAGRGLLKIAATVEVRSVIGASAAIVDSGLGISADRARAP